MKKFSVILCVLGLMHLSSLVLSAQEQIIEKLTVTVPVPVINHLPDLSGVTIDESKDVEIVSVKCPTAFVNYFLEDRLYKYEVIVRIKDGVNKIFSSNVPVTVNGGEGGLSKISDDKKEAQVWMRKGLKPIPESESTSKSTQDQPVASLIFNVDKPIAGKHAQKKITTSMSDKCEVVDVKWIGPMWNPDGTFAHKAQYKVQVTVALKRGVKMYFEPNAHDVRCPGAYQDKKEFSEDKRKAIYTFSYSSTPTQKELDDENARALAAKNAPPKPVAPKEDVLIAKMKTWLLGVKDSKPHYSYYSDSFAKNENYYLDNMEYEHPDGLKPFMFTTAVATFKAKDGYYFNKSLKLDEFRPEAETTTGFKVVNKKTVKVYLTAFTGAMGHNVKITEAMKEYKKKISELTFIPIARAQMYAPLFDHWDRKYRGRQWERSEVFVKSFLDKHMRSEYEYPTTEEFHCAEGGYVTDGKKSTFPSNYTIKYLDIIDDDLSDDIPGLVGEWCLLSNMKFLPKACLKDIQYGGMYKGAPAEIPNSPYKFAGGSGTLEDPYLIATAEQLNAVRKGPKKHYKLIADIDLSDWGNWVPIGSNPSYGFLSAWNKSDQYTHSFLGSFDGNGHVISGMQIVINEEVPFLTENVDWRCYGLFANSGTTPEEFKIKNLGVVNFNIDINYTDLKKEVRIYASPICGGMNQGIDMYNCYTKGGRININVIGNEKFKPIDSYGTMPDGAPTAYIFVGGIASVAGGDFFADAPRKSITHIEKCFNDSDINVSAKNCEYQILAGGITAEMLVVHVHECYNSGNITVPLDLEKLVGNSPMWCTASGICPYTTIPKVPQIEHKPREMTSYIHNCYNTGQLIGRSAAGITNVAMADIYLNNCYNTGTVIGNEIDEVNGMYTISNIYSKSSAIAKFANEFVENCSGNGNAVTGAAWRTSATLGRKVLVSIPEDTHPGNIYNKAPDKVCSFTDVDADVWYAAAVQWALDNNLIDRSATTFSPEKTCTRAEFLTYLWRNAGAPEMPGANPFSDVNASDSYYNAALWAKEKGLIDGTAFGAKTAVTREEFILTLWKSEGRPESLLCNQYLDIENHHQSDIGRAISWGHMNSIMGGTEAFKFSPKKTCTKAQVINFIHRYVK
ncbi:MAG: S-layer homology domain-containing protein [Bacteroidales bacterium]|nr:S-layer homology domain-containing protein [Bacteroidales bacterium]